MPPQATLKFGSNTVRTLQANIVRVKADAIVNAANSSLLGGGGVDGAIHRVGGPKILEDCRRIVSQIGRLPAGQAVATTAGDLPARYVIHTVGPIWSGGYEGEPEALASCYRESMSRAEELQLRSIAFPAISTGAFGYPFDEAAEIAIRTVFDSLAMAVHVREVSFVLFASGDYIAYEQRLDDFARERHCDFKVMQASSKDS